MTEEISIEDIRKGIESSILSGLIINCHKTKLNTHNADMETVIKDVFREIFENPSVKWMARAYAVQDSLTRLKDDLAMFLRDYGLSSIAHGKLIELVDEWAMRGRARIEFNSSRKEGPDSKEED